MATEDHIQGSEPDLAQLLVLEAGRILEDLTPELAMTLPSDQPVRLEHLEYAYARASLATQLLQTAHSIAKHH